MGIEVDLAALQQYEVDYTEIDHVRHIYKYQRSCGESVYIAGYRSQKFSQFYDEVEGKGLLFERSELGYE